MGPFILLDKPKTYVACAWDLSTDREAGEYWVAFFKRHLETILSLGHAVAMSRGEASASIARRAEACRGEFNAFFDDLLVHPQKYGRITILTMDVWRDQIIRRHGFVDAFDQLKDRENEKMLSLLPEVCRRLDLLSGTSQLRALIEGIFAGNIFDMGAEATAKKFAAGSPDFFATIDRLPPRPWLIDDFDALASRVFSHTHKKAVFFIDNAGSDFLLGALPLMRWLAKRGTKIILAANERPTLNDMTIHDVNVWWPRILAIEPSFAGLPIERISTGTGEPLIDLLEVSDELNAASADADLVILEGMGRGVESNLNAAFKCDALNLAMIKDTMVASRIGGNLYDVVCSFREGRSSP